MTVNSRIIGQSVETALDQLVHPAYARDGLALVWHEGTRAIHTRQGWKPIDSRPDYAGVLIDSGRAICFDAKHCADRHYRHSADRLHQLRAIWQVHNAGGLAGILVVNWEAERAWWLRPEPEWEYEHGFKVALEPGIAVVKVPAHPMFEHEFIPDWLAAVQGEER